MSGWEGICEESAFTFNLDMLYINRTNDGQLTLWSAACVAGRN